MCCVFFITGSFLCGSSWIGNHSTLLVHSSLRGNAAKSWSSSGLLGLSDVWLHPISGMTLRSFTLKAAIRMRPKLDLHWSCFCFVFLKWAVKSSKTRGGLRDVFLHCDFQQVWWRTRLPLWLFVYAFSYSHNITRNKKNVPIKH